jgi:Alr-MurF fusion protein
MQLNYRVSELNQILDVKYKLDSNYTIDRVAYDTRILGVRENTLFFCFIGDQRDGHNYIADAYEKGIRAFVIQSEIDTNNYPEALFFEVKDVLVSLQNLAKNHREKFAYPIIAITGSAGKTTVKEWLYHMLSSSYRIIRSPKSYNSQLGVALSLLELNEACDFALIEVGISAPNEMESLVRMVQPTYGVLTHIGSAHIENFDSIDSLIIEKVKLFKSCKKTWLGLDCLLPKEIAADIKGKQTQFEELETLFTSISFKDKLTKLNFWLVATIAKDLLISDENILSKYESLPQLALRMETFDGIHNNLIINDTYNLDFDALKQSLEYQLSIAKDKKRVVILGSNKDEKALQKLVQLTNEYSPIQTIIYDPSSFDLDSIKNAVILIKGSRSMNLQKLAKQFQLKKHSTFLEINLGAVRHNLHVFKSFLQEKTKILAMVKSAAYGTGAEKMSVFLEKEGVQAFGVAYADEGVELRNWGIQSSILVMNAESDGFEEIIEYNLEPAIYDFHQLDTFVKELIFAGKSNYPIHIKVDTGMRRLGFETNQMRQLADYLNSQPEIVVKSIYTHLAESDNLESSTFTDLQLERLHCCSEELEGYLGYSVDKHALNSEGVSRFSKHQMNMVRLGIGMYGYSSNPQFKKLLRDAIHWKSAISQIKSLEAGESVSYGRTFISPEPMKIAIIPVGYADGFRRSLSNGVGCVYIKDQACSVIGRVCMDMIMVDVSKLNCRVGDTVELIGENMTMEQFASLMHTIPYEVMTGISKRVHRVYIEE